MMRMKILLACMLGWASTCSWAQTAPVTPTQTTTPAGEPAVQRTVIEDEGSRIDELKVRGQTQRITVQPKVGTTKAYQIITSDGTRNLSDSHGAANGTTGKRVWQVLSF
ncbi:MAG: DUF2782 domain-containing protein [Rhizobacter sp.]